MDFLPHFPKAIFIDVWFPNASQKYFLLFLSAGWLGMKL